MQTFESRYYRESITVDDKVPTWVIRYHLGRVHVFTADSEVEAMIRDAVAAQRTKGVADWTIEIEEQTVRFALWQHAENRAGYLLVMG